MNGRSAQGKLEWQRRAAGYGDELREQIEQQSATRFAGWQARGRLPLWYRIKRAFRGVSRR